MNYRVCICVIAVTMLCAAMAAHASVLTFDELAVTGPNTAVPNGYGGFNWNNMWVTNGDDYPGSSYSAGAVSGRNVAYNGYSELATVELSSTDKFDLTSAYFTSAWENDNILTVKGFSNGSMLYSSTHTINTSGPLFIEFNYLDVDSVWFTTTKYQFAMDNMCVNESPNVPEMNPSMLAALGLVLPSLRYAIRRKRS